MAGGAASNQRLRLRPRRGRRRFSTSSPTCQALLAGRVSIEVDQLGIEGEAVLLATPAIAVQPCWDFGAAGASSSTLSGEAPRQLGTRRCWRKGMHLRALTIESARLARSLCAWEMGGRQGRMVFGSSVELGPTGQLMGRCSVGHVVVGYVGPPHAGRSDFRPVVISLLLPPIGTPDFGDGTTCRI